mgnify:CR=1 FL=1
MVLEFEIWRLKAITDLIYELVNIDYFYLLFKAELALWDERNQSVRLLYGVQPLAACMEVKNNHTHVATQKILYKFIEINFSVGCMVWP